MTLRLLLLAGCLGMCGGCALTARLGSDPTGREWGKVFYIGGAGPLGNVVGLMDVPKGLRKGGYRGAIEVFGWQSVLGGTLRDQMDRERNIEQALRLARRIADYVEEYPGRRVDIIALSAGTGITAWALEALPDDVGVGTVIFLSSSLSRHYDLTKALRHVEGRLYCFYSRRDPVLRYGTPVAGSVDREMWQPHVAGLSGFALPREADDATRRLYRAHVRNRTWEARYARYGYRGYHTDSTSPRFVARILTPLLRDPLTPGEPPAFDTGQRTTSD